jgi:hypothetical protein
MDCVIQPAAQKLLEYCRAENFAGYDPYDAVNSRLFSALPVLNTRWPRILLTQLLKRSPINLRPVLGIGKEQNPKAIGLFLSALLKLSDLRLAAEEEVGRMVERLIALRSPKTAYWCWGYSFPWQTRTLVVPFGAPNLVCTTFVAGSLLDAYEQRGDARCLEMAASAAEYILNELYWIEGGAAGFSYPQPSLKTRVHNSNFLAAALLCRVYRHTGERKFLEPAFRVARYSAAQQRADGSWPYGEAPTQAWIDNFHTGYNLCALQDLGRYAETTEFEACVRKGFGFYRDHFFLPDGAVRYFHDRTYPIDIHCVAQSILTLAVFRDLDHGNLPLAQKVLDWALEYMWDERGFFYYRVLRIGTIRTSYMRWSQAWMLLALATLLENSPGATGRRTEGSSAAPREAFAHGESIAAGEREAQSCSFEGGK